MCRVPPKCYPTVFGVSTQDLVDVVSTDVTGEWWKIAEGGIKVGM